MRLSEKIARWLSPDLARRADRHLWIMSQTDDVYRWCNGEARLVGQWLIERDQDYWRPEGSKPIGKLPQGISNFREWLYRQRDLSKSTQT
jgi:hypothetical protein